MKLNPKCNFANFLETVEHCTGDVVFTTTDGDVLNLKSELCRYIFAVVAANPLLLEKGSLICRDKSDLSKLESFLL
ncbi:MAG: hypothetical protein NC541_04245 [bacterium]|nr:hypothetical protein [bacterium]